MISPGGSPACAPAWAPHHVPSVAPVAPVAPRQPGERLHSGSSNGRYPGSGRYAGERGISAGAGSPRSRKGSLCGPKRDKDARARLQCMISLTGSLARLHCRLAPAPAVWPQPLPARYSSSGSVPPALSAPSAKVPPDQVGAEPTYRGAAVQGCEAPAPPVAECARTRPWFARLA
jgi:hypothetical protein